MATLKKEKIAGKEGSKPKKSNRTALKVAGGILAGAAAGAIAGVLLAPDSGKNTRRKIAEKSKKVAADVKAKVSSSFKNVKSRIQNSNLSRKAK